MEKNLKIRVKNSEQQVIDCTEALDWPWTRAGEKLETVLKHCDVQNSDFELFLLGHQRNVFFTV